MAKWCENLWILETGLAICLVEGLMMAEESYCFVLLASCGRSFRSEYLGFVLVKGNI